jgi:CRISPR-associated protein Cas1
MSRQLMNTLYVLTPGALARLEGDTVIVQSEGQKLIRVPLIHICSIVLFGGANITSGLMEYCAGSGKNVTFLDMGGRFRCRVEGPVSGNVMLRKAQFEASMNPELAIKIARPLVAGKIRNSRNTLLRAKRDSREKASENRISSQIDFMAGYLQSLPAMETIDQIRGAEGQCASCYFYTFGAMITRPLSEFAFNLRTRRPPRDRVNALLSFLYALLLGDCVGALETVGLDPQVGFLHSLRSGRPALGLDLMEEFRSPVADRLALTLMNRRQLNPDHFDERPGGAVLLNDEGRKIVITAYQKRKQEEVAHPLFVNKAPLGLIFQIQAQILARHLRGSIDSYVPYITRS